MSIGPIFRLLNKSKKFRDPTTIKKVMNPKMQAKYDILKDAFKKAGYDITTL